MNAEVQKELNAAKWFTFQDRFPGNEEIILIKDHEGNYGVAISRNTKHVKKIDMLTDWPMGFYMEWCYAFLRVGNTLFGYASDGFSVSNNPSSVIAFSALYDDSDLNLNMGYDNEKI